MSQPQSKWQLSVREILAGRASKDTPVTVKGWVRTRRDSKAGISFVHLSDGSSFHPVQVVAPNTLPNYQDEILKLTTACAIEATGTIVPSPAKGQPFEMQASAIKVIGWVDDPDTYPIQPKPHTLEFLRDVAHLRPRTNVIAAAIAFADLSDDATLAERLLKFAFETLLKERADDMAFFDERIEKGLLAKLQGIVSSEFVRMDYGEAIRILERAKEKFEFPVKWGIDLQSEHERYLTEKHAKKPVIVMNYPKDIKAFYMRVNDDGKTVAAMDVLAPGIGEIVGGSQREERLDVLEARMAERSIDKEHYAWYRDLRRYGKVPHAGFGLAPAFAGGTLAYVTGSPTCATRSRSRERRETRGIERRRETVSPDGGEGVPGRPAHPYILISVTGSGSRLSIWKSPCASPRSSPG